MSTRVIAPGVSLRSAMFDRSDPGHEEAEVFLRRMMAEPDLDLAGHHLALAHAETGRLVGAHAVRIIDGDTARSVAARWAALGISPHAPKARALLAALAAGSSVLHSHWLAVTPDHRGGTVRPAMWRDAMHWGEQMGAELTYSECWMHSGDTSLRGNLAAGYDEFARVRGYWGPEPSLIGDDSPLSRPAWAVDPAQRRCPTCGPAALCWCTAALVVHSTRQSVVHSTRPEVGSRTLASSAAPVAARLVSRRPGMARPVAAGIGLAAIVSSLAACDRGSSNANPEVLTCADNHNVVVSGSYCAIEPSSHPSSVPSDWNGFDDSSSSATDGPHAGYVPYGQWLAARRSAGASMGAHRLYATQSEPIGKTLGTTDVVNPKTGNTIDEDGGHLTSTGVEDSTGKAFAADGGYDSSNGGTVRGGGKGGGGGDGDDGGGHFGGGGGDGGGE